MLYPAFVTLLALLMYVILGFNVGRARYKYGVKAPAITGNPDFERRFRVQANTVEQLIWFLPSLWIFAVFWLAPVLASAIGAVWILGRILYAWGYYKDSGKRHIGHFISLACSLILLFGALAAVVMKMVELWHA